MSTDPAALRPALGRVARAAPVMPVAALLAAGVSMRSPLTAVSTILAPVQAGLSLPGWAPSVLNTLPTLCLGGFAFLGPRVTRRLGLYRLLLLCLSAIVAGDALRLITTSSAFFAGTTLVAAAIGLANVAAPGLIKSWFPSTTSTATAGYAAVMASAAAGAAWATGHFTGSAQPGTNHWIGSLALVTLPLGLASLGVWAFAARGGPSPARTRRSTTSAESESSGRSPRATTATWSVTAFFAGTTLLAYFVLGWLPTVLTDQGVVGQPALAFAVSTLTQVAGTLLAPIFSDRVLSIEKSTCLAAVITGISLLGVVEGPTASIVWISAILLGLAQGAAFSFALMLITLRSSDATAAASLSARAQGLGYLVGCAGPLGAGFVHSWTGSWKIPLAGLVVIAGGQAAAGLHAGRVEPSSRSRAA